MRLVLGTQATWDEFQGHVRRLLCLGDMLRVCYMMDGFSSVVRDRILGFYNCFLTPPDWG